jgi:hypothetical protein
MKPYGAGGRAKGVAAKKIYRARSPSSERSSNDDEAHRVDIRQSSTSSSSREFGVVKKMRCTSSSLTRSCSSDEYKRVVIRGSPSSSRINSGGYAATGNNHGNKITIDLVSSSSEEVVVGPQNKKPKEKLKAKEKVNKRKEKKKVNYWSMHSLYQID